MAPKADAKAPKADAKKKVKKEVKEGDAPAEDKMSRPDRGEFDANAKKHTDEVEKLQKQLKELSSQIGDRSTGKEEFYQQKSQIRDKVMKESDAINELMKRKDEILQTMKLSNESDKQSRMELQKMRKNLGFDSTEAIDDRIASIEFKLHTETLILKEEKKLLEEIKQLKKDKPKVKEYYAKEAQVKENKGASVIDKGSVKEQLDAISGAIAKHKESKAQFNEELKKLTEERQKQVGDMPDLFEKRDKINQDIREQIKARDALRDEFKKAENDYYTWERAQRDQRRSQQQAQRAQQDQERKKWAREKRVEALDQPPHQHEITLLEQTIKFCKGFEPKEEKVEEEKKETKHDMPSDKHVVLVDKKTRDDEFYFAPTKKGKDVKKKAKTSTQQIKHNAVTFKLFKELDLDPPINAGDIPGILEKLDAKMDLYKKLIQTWEETKEEQKRKIMAGEDLEEEEKEEAAPTEAKEEEKAE